MIAQIVRTVQKATCGDIKNLKRSGTVCEPLPVKSTAKKYKVFPASSICSPLTGVTSDSWDTPAGHRVYDACRGFSVS